MDEHTISRHQRTSTELVVFSRLAEQVVTISWPTNKGVKILASGLKNYRRTRGLFIECFCAFGSDANEPRSSQIVVSNVTDDVFVCVIVSSHSTQSLIASELVNFSKVYRTSLLKSSFNGLPTLASGNVPDTGSLLVAFVLQSFPPEEIAPHFEDYFGEHISEYPNGTLQLSGPFLPRRRSNTQSSAHRRHSSPYARVQMQTPSSNRRYWEIDDVYPSQTRQAHTAPARIPRGNAVAGPSRLPIESASHTAPFPLSLPGNITEGKEAKFLRKLIVGQGVAENIWDGLFEKCTMCKRVFTATRAQGAH
ncbi:hypothetical protein C8J57DRAFT_1604151 [Mycena rebaudengoi]|nr:hypothetical protein C8J57DRAFT_1604151 [Mycena rebaudengoi]